MRRIVVLQGGTSLEREISLISGAEISKALKHMGYKVCELDPATYPTLIELVAEIKDYQADMVFNALHGGDGENGKLAAALQMSGIPFTGSGYKASCLAMDKYISKLIAKAEGITCPKDILMRGNLIQDYNDPEDYSGFAEKLGLPMIVKPNDSGSSVGISIVHKLDQLKEAVEAAFRQCDTVLLEEYIPGREITVSILGGKALPVVEIRPKNGWYDYHNKYTKGSTEYLAPAPLAESISQLVSLYAERIFFAMSCSVYARVDFRLNQDKLYFLELNTLPGMTPLSLTPMAAKAAGMSFEDLLEHILDLSKSSFR
nr:D-alanine-D-alanine ligase [Candidatus Cloacimonadota bacterium]